MMQELVSHVWYETWQQASRRYRIVLAGASLALVIGCTDSSKSSTQENAVISGSGCGTGCVVTIEQVGEPKQISSGVYSVLAREMMTISPAPLERKKFGWKPEVKTAEVWKYADCIQHSFGEGTMSSIAKGTNMKSVYDEFGNPEHRTFSMNIYSQWLALCKAGEAMFNESAPDFKGAGKPGVVIYAHRYPGSSLNYIAKEYTTTVASGMPHFYYTCGYQFCSPTCKPLPGKRFCEDPSWKQPVRVFEEQLNGAVLIPRQTLDNGKEIDEMLVCPVSGIVFFEPEPDWAVCTNAGWAHKTGSSNTMLRTPIFSD